MKKSPEILVIGAGAVGGIVAALLKSKGFNVSLIARTKAQANTISSDGIEITGTRGTIKVQLSAVHEITRIKKRPDIVLLATKATDMPSAARALLPLILEDTMIVSLQNGIVEEELSEIVGIDRTVGCVVGWGATMHSERKMEMTSNGEFVIGYLNKKPDKNLGELARILSNILPVTTTDSILTYLYSKLIVNSCITTVGAICGLPLGKMLNQKLYRILFISVIDEAIAVANAMAWKIPNYAGKLNYYKLLEWGKIRQHMFLRLFGFKYRRLKSSSLQSLERGRKTEIHYLNGFISQKGKEHGIATPVNDKLIKLVEEIESGSRSVSELNFQS